MASIHFTSLPNEVLLEICTSPVLGIPDMAAVARASRFMRALVMPALRAEMFKRRCSKYCRRALYHAAGRRDLFAVASLLERGVLGVLEDGGTLLNSAVGTLSGEGLETLLVCGVDPNTEDERGRTPLICATSGRCLGAIRVLLADDRVDVNRAWIFGDFAALHLAVWNEDPDVVKLLLSCPRIAVNQGRGSVPSGTSMSQRDGRVLAGLLEDPREGECPPLSGGWPPLHAAVARTDQTIFGILLQDERVDVNLPSVGGETPLRVAVRHNNIPAVCMLMAHPKIQLHQLGGSILHFAVACGGAAMVKAILRSESIHINWPNSGGETALHLAVSLGRGDVIPSFLRRHDIDIEIVDGLGRSAGDRALLNRPGIARLLTNRQIAGRRQMDYLDIIL